MDAPLGRQPSSDGHFQGTDLQVAFHSNADSSTDYTPGMQIGNDGQIEPSSLRPDIADATGPFPVRTACMGGAPQQVWRDIVNADVKFPRSAEVTFPTFGIW